MLTIFFVSTEYGIQELPDRIYEGLTKKGFDVWMSYKGTVPVSPGKNNAEWRKGYKKGTDKSYFGESNGTVRAVVRLGC